MKKIAPLLICFCFLAFHSVVYGQADLTLGTGNNITPTTLNYGQTIYLTLNVNNTGSSASGNCLIGIYISPTPTFTDATFYSAVSLESIPAGGSSSNIQFAYPIPYNTKPGVNYVLIYIDENNAVPEYNETNNGFYFPSLPLSINSSPAIAQNLPYPLIYVHGLYSNCKTWDSLLATYQNYYGWSFGGDMHFCLNQDATYSVSVAGNDYKDWTNTSLLTNADFYRVNFDVDPNGSPFNNTVESNQSAIIKQGLAIKDAVGHVMQATGKDKVILVGHSMGGLASREYLQNSTIWQPDAQHHIAKLFTVGTPHGGSNAPTFGIAGPDGQSEAMRDLRISYFYSSNPGVYLFGGTENLPYMDDQLCCYFYNADVNCNGVIGESIAGLNQKTIPTNLSYACIIGCGSNLGGDGAVAEFQANLNNYYTLNADTFRLDEPPIITTTWHEHLTEQVKGNVKGIDEPAYFTKAYEAKTNELYFGIISEQSAGSLIQTDFDDYKINVAANGNLTIQIFDILLPQLKVEVFNSAYTSVYSTNSNGKSYLNTNVNLNPGTYFVEISASPTGYSWYYPYAFRLNYPAAIGIHELQEEKNNITVFPNPASDRLNIYTEGLTLENSHLTIIDDLGQLMINTDYQNGIDISSLGRGIYFLTITTPDQKVYHSKFIKQ